MASTWKTQSIATCTRSARWMNRNIAVTWRIHLWNNNSHRPIWPSALVIPTMWTIAPCRLSNRRMAPSPTVSYCHPIFIEHANSQQFSVNEFHILGNHAEQQQKQETTWENSKFGWLCNRKLSTCAVSVYFYVFFFSSNKLIKLFGFPSGQISSEYWPEIEV